MDRRTDRRYQVHYLPHFAVNKNAFYFSAGDSMPPENIFSNVSVGLTYFPIRHKPTAKVLAALTEDDIVMSTFNDEGEENQQWFFDGSFIRNMYVFLLLFYSSFFQRKHKMQCCKFTETIQFICAIFDILSWEWLI